MNAPPKLLDQRRVALEEAFFAIEDARRRETLRDRMKQEGDAAALARACGMPASPEVLAPLVRHGVTAETLPALFLVPLLAVAWADDQLSRTERLELLAQARDMGVEPGSPCHELLGCWLESRPEPALFEAWRAYAAALCEALDEEQRDAVAGAVLWRARQVARADGGVLRVGRRVSAAERRELHDLARALGSR